MGTTTYHRRLVFVVVVALLFLLAPAANALAASVSVRGASVLSGTQVKITFSKPVDATAGSPARYVVSPALAVTSALRTDGNYSVLLTTAAQTNATQYAVSVSGITGMYGTQSTSFIGTTVGAATQSAFQDDFNRPSGLTPTDTPIPGLWTIQTVDLGNELSFVTSPTFSGSGALRARATSLDPEADNASLLYNTGGPENFVSAYVYIPSGQRWRSNQQVGLLRLNQYAATAHARITAFAQSTSAYTLKVNWKESSTIGYHGDTLVTTGVTFGAWHWLQLHVKNGAAGVGEVQVFVDGRLAFSQNTIAVQSVAMKYAEVGIMHMTSTGPSSTTYTDQVRLGTAYQLPSRTFDTAAPSGVTLSAPVGGSVFDAGTMPLSATASDNTSVQRVDFLVDGTVVASDDVAPFETTVSTVAMANGSHAVEALAYDTSGNAKGSAPVNVTVDNTSPEVLSPAVTPAAFSPNGDGYADTAAIAYTTTEPTEQSVVILDSANAVVKTLVPWTAQLPAGPRSVTWDGRYYDKTTATNQPVPDGTYTVRIQARDFAARVTTVTLPVTVNRVLSGLARTLTTFSPNGDGRNDTTAISYTLSGAAAVTVSIEQLDGTPVRTLQAETAQEAGTYTGVIWDGKDDAAAAMPDGKYIIRVSAMNGVGRIDSTKSVTIDVTAPTVSLDSITPDPWDPSLGVLTVAFTTSEAGTATVKFYKGAASSSSQTVTLSVTAAGPASITWDGVTKDGLPADAGAYKAKIYFVDKTGTFATVYPVIGIFQLQLAPVP